MPGERMDTAGERRALVVGDLGIVGGNLVASLLERPDWYVVGLARGERPSGERFQHRRLDLLDAEACRRHLPDLGPVTHLFYAARSDRPDPAEEAEVNLCMLSNVLDNLPDGSLRHVCLVHGTKWYGSHLGAYKTPAKEDDPRQLPPNFYYSQQDSICERRRGAAWTWSAVRPHTISGVSLGYPYNLVTLVGAYAAICRELGSSFAFPGREACYRSVSQLTDVGLLSRAMIHVATDSRCGDQAFNVVNGDHYRWCDLWPKIAALFDLETGPVRSSPLARLMADKEPVWDAIVERHGLQRRPLTALANWRYGDFQFSWDWDDLSSPIKLNRHGFTEMVDSEDSFLGHLSTLRRMKILP